MADHPICRRLIASGLALAGASLVRSRMLRWGATDAEQAAPLPGDDLLAAAHLTANRAITIDAAARDVWPWIVQIGQGRGGFYSYDGLENLAGCDIHSADRIVAMWQHLDVGDVVNLAPDVGLTVAAVEPGRALVLRGGVPIGGTPPPFDFTWAFVLHESHAATRLLVRERYAYTRRWAVFLVEPVEAVSFVMTRRMLTGIRDRAERTTPASAQLGTPMPRAGGGSTGHVRTSKQRARPG